MRLQRKFAFLSNQADKSVNSLPPINTTQFSSRLDDLLNKVDIQNRYASRISQCNSKNMEQLQKARKELHRIAEQKKMKELRAGSDSQFLEQIMRRVTSSEGQLKQVFKELVDAKRQIKNLKKQISELRKVNLQYQKQIMQLKRQKYFEISVAKEQVQNHLTSTQVKNFLSTSSNIHSTLYQYCLQVFKNNDFTNFLTNLDKKINGEQPEDKVKFKRNKSHSNQYRFTKAQSGIKLKISRKRQGRLNTEHIENMRIHS